MTKCSDAKIFNCLQKLGKISLTMLITTGIHFILPVLLAMFPLVKDFVKYAALTGKKKAKLRSEVRVLNPFYH